MSRTTPAGFPVNQFNIDPSMDADWLYLPLGATYSAWLNASSIATFEQCMHLVIINTCDSHSY